MTIACPCVLLGGPSCAAGAESLTIAGATYREPGVSGPGWAWTDDDHLDLNGYAGEAIGAGPGVGVRVYGVCLQNAGLGDGAAGCRLSVDVSWLDAAGAVAPHVVIELDVATPPAGETDGVDVPGDSADKSPADANPAAGEPTTETTANPALKPAATTTKATTTVTKTTVAKVSKPKAATATTAALPKTGDNNWVVASMALFLLGTVLLAAACRC